MRLIDAEKLDWWYKGRPIRRVIDEAPTVDAVPVVRCKDCIYYEIGKDYEPYCNHVTHGIPYPKNDDFCSYGERKDNEL